MPLKREDVCLRARLSEEKSFTGKLEFTIYYELFSSDKKHAGN